MLGSSGASGTGFSISFTLGPSGPRTSVFSAGRGAETVPDEDQRTRPSHMESGAAGLEIRGQGSGLRWEELGGRGSCFNLGVQGRAGGQGGPPSPWFYVFCTVYRLLNKRGRRQDPHQRSVRV